MSAPSKAELIRWGESQQDGNCLAPAKYRFVENNLDEVRKDYNKFHATSYTKPISSAMDFAPGRFSRYWDGKK